MSTVKPDLHLQAVSSHNINAGEKTKEEAVKEKGLLDVVRLEAEKSSCQRLAGWSLRMRFVIRDAMRCDAPSRTIRFEPAWGFGGGCCSLNWLLSP